jgi:hypothetical protein
LFRVFIFLFNYFYYFLEEIIMEAVAKLLSSAAKAVVGNQSVRNKVVGTLATGVYWGALTESEWMPKVLDAVHGKEEVIKVAVNETTDRVSSLNMMCAAMGGAYCPHPSSSERVTPQPSEQKTR